MSGSSAAWRIAQALLAVVALAAGLGSVAPRAQAFEYFDGRIQVHGFFEEQVRAISADYNQSLDLTQWYNVFNLEIDLEIAPDGWGPFDSIGGFIRAEVRYDCVWTRACGLSHSTDVYGNRSEFLPQRLSQAKDPRNAGAVNYQDFIWRQPFGEIETRKVYPAVNNNTNTAQLLPSRTDSYRGVNQTSPFDALLDTRVALGFGGVPCGGPGQPGCIDYVPGRYTFQEFLSYGFALRNVRGGNNGFGTQAMPWDPKDGIDPQGTLANIVNPFRPQDVNPVVGIPGLSLPYRPGPNFAPLQGPSHLAKGLFVPSKPYSDYVLNGGSDGFDQNFSQSSLEWNRGASQRQTKELKEAYLEFEMFEGRLFVRAGRQTIVWGKTELFATTDLFNPTDLALGSLVSLEESRIPIWALRAIYSFYSVGPLEDVRLEVALDLDEFYPVDLGRCGEPYTPNPVCNKTFGLLAHGIAGIAVAGEDRPDIWWESAEGLQGGARLEFRWERFSFALVDFWNYVKIPYADRLTTFSRNVDPNTGRPRRYGATGPCTTGNPAVEPACLGPGNDALVNASTNQQIYGVICSSSIGFSSLDRSVCAQSVLTSPNLQAGIQITQLVAQLASGSPNGIGTTVAFTSPLFRIPLVSLNIDPTDGQTTGQFALLSSNPAFNFTNGGGPGTLHNGFQSVAQVLTPQQQALLGCGPFYGTTCDGGVPGQPLSLAGQGGIDLLNAEASALVQSWVGFDGTPIAGLDTTNPNVAQPGTVGFRGGPVCTRVTPGGQVVMLPGCRGPGDPGYDPAVDGPDPSVVNIGFPAGYNQGGPLIPNLGDPALGAIISRQGHPFTGQIWRSEMAALSWNLQMVLVAFSTTQTSPKAPGDPGSDPMLRFDPTNAYRTDGCSYVVPWMCSAVRAFWGVTGNQRNTVYAGGNGRFGRRDFAWAMGGDVVLRYQKRNVLGFSVDFAEDVTATNWSTEFTWVKNNPFTNNDEFDGISKEDVFNLTVSVDRPTFINFLNASRTFFFNSQWFFNYTPNYDQGFTANGPWNVFFTFTIQTGYFQDRLLPGVTWVYDFMSNSGAVLPQVTYRFTEVFSVTFGLANFWGRYQGKPFPINPLAPSNQVHEHAYQEWVENGLGVIRDRDEVFLRLRYAF